VIFLYFRQHFLPSHFHKKVVENAEMPGLDVASTSKPFRRKCDRRWSISWIWNCF